MKKYFRILIVGLFVLLVFPGLISAHTIHFETLGETQFDDITVEDGETIGLYQYVPELEGYMFDQWTTNSDYSYGGGYASWPGDYYYNVKSDMTFYAYFYDRVYTYAYNKTTNETDKFVGKVINIDYPCEEGYCTVLEPYSEEWNTVSLQAVANPGFRFVEWRIGYNMPDKNHIANNYQGLDYSDTQFYSTNSTITATGGNGFITFYAVFEEDPNSNVTLLSEAHATIEEPVIGGVIPNNVVATSTQPSKYTANSGDCWVLANDYNCISGNFEEGNSYSIYVNFEPAEGYRFGKNTKFYVNDNLLEVDNRYTSIGETSVFGNAIFSFSVPEPVYTIVFDYNGGSREGEPTYTTQTVGFVLMDSKENMMDGITAPSGKDLDYLLINGERHELNSGIEINKNMTIKYIWKSINQEEVVKPDVPNISIAKGKNNSLIINWPNDENVTRYEVYKSTDKKKWTKYNSTNASSYESKSLTYGKTYYYRVKACNEAGCSKYSVIVNKKVVPDKVKLNIKSAGTNNVKLSWEKVSVTGYEIYNSTDNKKWTKVATVSKNTTLEYNVKKLKSNKTYYFKVRAYKTVSGKKIYGSYSSVVSTKTAPVSPEVKLSLKDIKSMNLVINASKGATKYVVQNSLDGKTYEALTELTGAETLVRSEQELGVTYYYRVKACNAENRCSAWVSVSLKQTPKTPKLTLSTTSKKVKSVLSKVDGAAGYKLYMATSKNGKYTTIKEFTSEDELLEYTTKTKKGKTYYFKVRSYTVLEDSSKVYSPYSSIKSIKSK